MTLGAFLQFVEIQTKPASVIPFALGTLYSLYHFHQFNAANFMIMLVSLLSFDMATTAINNYMDYKKATRKQGYNYEQKNAMVRDGITETTAQIVIFVLLAVATLFGIWLTLKTDIVVLLIGMLCFAVGILYTWGPIPISRMPLGEVFSGFFMGFIIMFLSIYIHIVDLHLVSINFSHGILTMNMNLVELLYIFLFSIPAINGIANIMLANNICDVDEDILNKRFTLPYYIGRDNALKLFAALYYIGFVDTVVLTLLGVAPPISLLILLTLIPVHKNIRLFQMRPMKSETFVLSVQNFAVMNVAQILSVSVMLLFNTLVFR